MQVSVACTILGVSGGNDSLSLMRLAGGKGFARYQCAFKKCPSCRHVRLLGFDYRG